MINYKLTNVRISNTLIIAIESVFVNVKQLKTNQITLTGFQSYNFRGSSLKTSHMSR